MEAGLCDRAAEGSSLLVLVPESLLLELGPELSLSEWELVEAGLCDKAAEGW